MVIFLVASIIKNREKHLFQESLQSFFSSNFQYFKITFSLFLTKATPFNFMPFTARCFLFCL